MHLGNDQYMCGGLGIYVAEGEYIAVLIYLSGGDIAGCDGAEKTIHFCYRTFLIMRTAVSIAAPMS